MARFNSRPPTLPTPLPPLSIAYRDRDRDRNQGNKMNAFRTACLIIAIFALLTGFAAFEVFTSVYKSPIVKALKVLV